MRSECSVAFDSKYARIDPRQYTLLSLEHEAIQAIQRRMAETDEGMDRKRIQAFFDIEQDKNI